MIADDSMPAIDESVVADAEALGISASSVTGTRALTGGRGGRTWAIDAAGDRYVLHRRAAGSPEALAPEVLATSAAAEIGVGPEVVAVGPARGLLLTRWIPGRAASAPGAAGPHLGAILRSLRALHSVALIQGRPVAEVLPAVDPLTTRTGYLAAAGLRGSALDDLAAELAALAVSRPSVLIHGDPVPGNLIVAAEAVHLVDFEYAGAGDPWYELGHLAASVHLDALTISDMLASEDSFEQVDRDRQDREAIAVEAWSYIAAQAWGAWVALGHDLGARSPRWRRWADRAAARIDHAVATGRVDRLTAQLRAERPASQ